ncbi:MAG: MFS transporter [Sphingomonadaceae bacterium]
MVEPVHNRPLAVSVQPASTISRGRMVLLFAVMLTTAAGNTAMQSVMPSIGTELGVADVWISLAYTWSALLWVICAPLWARRSDHRGRKAMMAVGLLGFIFSFGICGSILLAGLQGLFSATATLLMFAAARSLYGGFGSAAPPAVQAYVASRTPRAQRTKMLAIITSSFGLGTVVGPALAPLMIFPLAGLAGPFFIFALIGVAVLIALRLQLPNDNPSYAARGSVAGAPFSASASNSFRQEDDGPDRPDGSPDPTPPSERLSWRDTRLRPWLVAGVAGGHAQAALLGIAGFFILDRLGLRATPAVGAGPVGLVLMCGAIATLLAQWGLIPNLNLGPRVSVLSGMTISLCGTIGLAFAHDLHTIALAFAFTSLGFGLFRPGFNAGSSLAVTKSEQGQVGGIVTSINGTAYILAPALGVWFYDHYEWVAFAMIAGLCCVVLMWGSRTLHSDAAFQAMPAEDD